VVFTINIPVNIIAVRLEGNTDKYGGGRSVPARQKCGGGRFMELPTTALVECSSLLRRV